MLTDLKPRRKYLMFDLAEKAGLDMRDWRDSSNDPRGPKANPKYCYEWAYVEPGKLVILNLWHANMVEEKGKIIQRENFRSDAEFHRTVSGKWTWAARARRFDDAIQTALRDNLPVRVIIQDGLKRKKEVLDSLPSSVKCRDLDPEPWTITSYDWATGAHELTRGLTAERYVDQFDVADAASSPPERRYRDTSAFIRDLSVRRRALRRAAGCCELCGQAGFRMDDGTIYLETHHVIPLAEGGGDVAQNVVALCAHDHRRAHFAEERSAIRDRLLDFLRASH
jgi:hypothetical protein